VYLSDISHVVIGTYHHIIGEAIFLDPIGESSDPPRIFWNGLVSVGRKAVFRELQVSQHMQRTLVGRERMIDCVCEGMRRLPGNPKGIVDSIPTKRYVAF
jgi:hypothetical protein